MVTMVVKMKMAFLAVLLLRSLCQAFPTTMESETPQKSSILGGLRKCCEKLHLAGEKSIFKNFHGSTGTDYKLPAERCRRCCHSKRPEDAQQNPAAAGTTVSDQITLGAAAYELGNAQAQHGLIPDMDGSAEGTGTGTGTVGIDEDTGGSVGSVGSVGGVGGVGYVGDVGPDFVDDVGDYGSFDCGGFL